ncbi:hypothetical protein ASPBRDRAFT_217734 [Aspergillus brasiliensis CBS 101740]|uniref:Uncharacterized protein n=1 Tax=Aspergillus brasiliensis (strain CBS 101740 / IMI 381727 / IBT 21946) TaxID=767769 RepID=A0A1L9UYQ2_ASPBC|nr:hypothetical protein ASPBRDRAFT_217734 [Aspergillus brasiliensis CBS 101740]
METRIALVISLTMPPTLSSKYRKPREDTRSLTPKTQTAPSIIVIRRRIPVAPCYASSARVVGIAQVKYLPNMQSPLQSG